MEVAAAGHTTLPDAWVPERLLVSSAKQAQPLRRCAPPGVWLVKGAAGGVRGQGPHRAITVVAPAVPAVVLPVPAEIDAHSRQLAPAQAQHPGPSGLGAVG
jgi:hypothetical protein